MHTQVPDTERLEKLRRFRRMDHVAMAFYTVLVYAWFLHVHALGRDFGLLSDPGCVAGAGGWLLGLETAWFDGRAMPYRAVNLLLLYGCMLAIYHLVRVTLGEPHWMGNLAAVLFMANPVHTEAVLNLSGSVDLLPALFALTATAVYAANARRPSWWRYCLAFAFFSAAVLAFGTNLGLLVVLILFEYVFLDREAREPRRLLPLLLPALAAVAVWRDYLPGSGFDAGAVFGPLYLIFYPIGFLPETARRFHAQPWLGWLAGATVVVVLWLVARKVRRPLFLWGLGAMAAMRLFQGDRFVDPVHMVGGGILLAPNAFFNVSLVVVFRRMMDNPKWYRTTIGFTTALCVLFFVFQIRSGMAWRVAGARVREFQESVAAAKADPGGPLGAMPDFQYYRGAPMCLSESVWHDSPFSARYPVRSVLPLHYEPGIGVEIRAWSPEGGRIVVHGVEPLDVVPWPYGLSREGVTVMHGGFRLTREGAARPSPGRAKGKAEAFTVYITPVEVALPPRLLPGTVHPR